MNDFDIATDKFDQSAQRVMDRAAEESRRREHAIVATEHLFLALAQVEWDTFSHVTQDLEVNPHVILDALEERLERLPTLSGREPRLAPSAKNVVKLAFLRASRDGRTIASPDLFSAILEESHGVPVSIVRRHGLSPDVFASRITTHMRDHELREEQLRKRLELPETLRRVATNMNLLARQNKIPPVYGRDKEIQQVLEILCHRERSNSVMLIGEPGVGKTAIVEGLARRLELEPGMVPARLRGCQVVSLQMNSLVAGTMLRGMFEDRIQNVIRRDQGAPEPDPVRRRGAYADWRRVRARRRGGCGQHIEGCACQRRGADDWGDHSQRVQGVHPGRRGAGAPVPHRAGRRAEH